MAPTIPKKRPAMRAKASHAGSGLMPRPHREGAIIDDGFINSKKDKRTIKHSAFVNRIEKVHKKPLRRRRPNKKLITNLESLGDVLGELESGLGAKKEPGKFTEKSLKSRPGALKRKGKLEFMEKERFGKNIAQLVAGTQTQTTTTDALVDDKQAPVHPIATGWAALRGFISQTMEQKEEFKST